MQSQESNGATRDRKLSQKGKEYMIETLRHHRDAANKRLRRQMKKVNLLFEEIKDIEILTSEAEELDALKEDLNQAFKQYHDLMETEEDREASYQYFDLIDREFSELRLTKSSQIHAIKKRPLKKNRQSNPHTQVVCLARNPRNCPAPLHVQGKSRLQPRPQN